jgi:hypothetical protein
MLAAWRAQGRCDSGIEIVCSRRPQPQYSREFTLPTAQWQEHGDVLATSLELYRTVEPACAAVGHLHAVPALRRTRADTGRSA